MDFDLQKKSLAHKTLISMLISQSAAATEILTMILPINISYQFINQMLWILILIIHRQDYKIFDMYV